MSPPAFLDSCNGQCSSFKSSSGFCSFHNDMNSSSSNSNYGFRNSNETNTILGFNSPPLAASRNPGGAAAAGSGSNLSRPRLMKMRRQTSHNPRSTTAPGSRRGEEADVGLGFNPFRTSSESVYGNSSSRNVAKETFLFGAASNNNPSSNLGSERGVPSVVLDDMRKLKIDGDKSYANATGGNAAFNFKGFESENKKSFDESMVDQLPKEINKLNIGGSGNLGSMKNFQDVNPLKSRFTNTFHSNVEAELQHEMHKMNLGNPGTVGWASDNLKSFVFGRNSKTGEHLLGRSEPVNPGKQHDEEKVKADLISDRMGELKVTGAGDDNLKNFVFGANSKTGDGLLGRSELLNPGKQHNEEEVKADLISDRMREVKADLISDRMRELKVSGAGEASGFSTVFDNKMQSGTFLGKNSGGTGVSFDHRNIEPKVNETTSSSHFQPFGNASSMSKSERNVEFTFTSKLDNLGAPNVELKTPNIKGDLFSGAKSIPEAKKESVKDTRLKKKKGKRRKPVIGQLRPKQDFVFGQRSSLEIPDSFEAYSPMDVSPYHETLADNYSRGTSVTTDDASQMNDHNSVSSESHLINSNVTTDEDLLVATQRLDVSDGDVKCALAREEVSEAESFRSATENMEYSSDTFATALDSEVSSTATSGRQEKASTRLFKFASKLENISKDNFTFAASSSSQGQLSPDTRQHKKKHRLKTGLDSYSSTSDAKNTYASSSTEFFPISGNSSILSPGKTQKVDISTLSNKNKDNFKPMSEQDSKHGTFSTASASIAAEEACEKWRLRGNQAYGKGDLAKAEDYYTRGLNSVSQTEKSRSCLRALMLCYSNRAATRISLGRMREALKDCLMAAAIDPNFLKVQVRAAHCYLAIGEVENATLQYMKCLQSGNDVCVDRKLLVEASEGLEKAQKVTECIKQYTELPRRTADDLECAMRVIDEALQISSYSDQLLQMKADTLLMLRWYEQVIQMCEQTPSSDEMDTSTSPSSWRSSLIVKSYFYLGRLEEALEFIKKQESSGHLTERLGSMSLESVIPLADTVHELLSRKAAGNEAYKSGRYAEAVEHYTAALSCSVESRPFAAICFCNRAAAYRALGQITDAIADCSVAIALDPSYLKAISRRASLYEMIRDYGQAAIDLRRLVSLLTSQMEEKGILSGVSDKSSGMNELRQTQLRLYNIEEESRKEIPLNMYLILGVESTAAASEVKKAYRKAALKHHPDKAALSLSRSDNGDDGLWKEIAENVHKDADRLFKMIGEAYAVLSNPSKRSRYDLEEEMRNEVNRFTRSSSGRMAADVQSPVFERSGSRRWQDSWRPYVHTQSKDQEKTGSSYRYSRHS